MSALHPIMAQALAPFAPAPRTVEWQVTLEFRKGPAFSIKLSAPSEVIAIVRARQLAIGSGFTDPERKATARPA